MKIPREARSAAKRLFQSCRVNGALDEGRARQAAQAVASARPRHSLAILSQFQRLVALDLQKSTAVIESAVPLGAAEAEITGSLRSRFGAALKVRTEVKPGLLGGLRLRVGSDVWDGTVRGRLDALARSF
jgi:F-type H+-transporting ATPase subunit delta